MTKETTEMATETTEMATETTAELLSATVKKEDKTLSTKKRAWTGFVEGDLVNTFTTLGFEKMTVEDGKGNKAKLVKKADGSINVKCESTSIL